MPTRAPTGKSTAKKPDSVGLPPPIRVGGHLALDFLNTIAAPRGTPIEWIENGHDLVNWLVSAGALDLISAARIAAGWPPEDLDKVAKEAVDLREWFRGVVVRAKGGGTGALAVEDVERLNGVLARDATYRCIEPADVDGRFRVVSCRPWCGPGELLAPIAAAIADLVCEGDFDLVHRCENPPCTLWFYDRTKGHRRRWCSQAACGNRAKVAAHRERKRQAR